MTQQKAPEVEKPVFAADTLHMRKGEEAIISVDSTNLRRVRVGLGWDVPEKVEGVPVDIDASAFLLNREGRVRRDSDFVFYNNLQSEGYVIKHQGDNTSGAGDGDDESISLDLDALPFDIEKVAFTVTIHNAEERQHTFSSVKNAFIRIFSEDDNKELAHFDLSEDASNDTAMIFGEIVREASGWKFKALGQGSKGGLYKLAREFGVNVAAP